MSITTVSATIVIHSTTGTLREVHDPAYSSSKVTARREIRRATIPRKIATRHAISTISPEGTSRYLEEKTEQVGAYPGVRAMNIIHSAMPLAHTARRGYRGFVSPSAEASYTEETPRVNKRPMIENIPGKTNTDPPERGMGYPPAYRHHLFYDDITPYDPAGDACKNSRKKRIPEKFVAKDLEHVTPRRRGA